MSIKTIIFDLDGTLLNTLGDLTDAVNAALAQYGYPAHSDEAIRRFVGNGVGKLLQRALPDGTDDAEIERCLTAFHAYYEAHMMCRTQPYDGIPALLAALKARGIVMGVLSNKYDAAACALTARYFPGQIDLTLGERPGVPRKPDPTAVCELLERLHANAQTTLYVGDSNVDMTTAKNAGLYAVGVTWGFREREILLQAGADCLIDSPAELLPLLDKTDMRK